MDRPVSQNFSIAGNRQGLEGSESGLFLEMIRIIKEMRKATNGDHPKFILLENVPGIFSSNNGNDFSAVLTEFIRILEPESPDVPCPQEGWPKAGIIFLPNGSLAWRTHDAQLWGRTVRDSDTGDVLFMGTPQRRRRVSVVVDLRGKSAPEILFESTVMSGNPQQSQKTGEDPARTAPQSTGVSGGDNRIGVDLYNHTITGNIAYSINANTGMSAGHAGPTVLCKQERERERERA